MTRFKIYMREVLKNESVKDFQLHGAEINFHVKELAELPIDIEF